jgi:ABC-type transporter Mla MlaB component
MSTIAMFVKIDGKRVAEGLQEAQSKLNSSSEAVLDFTSVLRVQPKDLAALEELVQVAEDRGIKIELNGVNVGIYKVLKLAQLASRFAFRA